MLPVALQEVGICPQNAATLATELWLRMLGQGFRLCVVLGIHSWLLFFVWVLIWIVPVQLLHMSVPFTCCAYSGFRQLLCAAV